MLGKKNFLVKHEYGQKKYMNYVSLSYVRSKEEVCLEIDGPISDLNQKEKGGLLAIDGNPVVKEASMFEIGIYCKCFIAFVMLSRYQWICWRNRCCNRDTRN